MPLRLYSPTLQSWNFKTTSVVTPKLDNAPEKETVTELAKVTDMFPPGEQYASSDEKEAFPCRTGSSVVPFTDGFKILHMAFSSSLRDVIVIASVGPILGIIWL